jgi:hypothetical protein
MLTEHERRVLYEIDRAEAAHDPLFAVCLASMQASDAQSTRRRWVRLLRAAAFLAAVLATAGLVGLVVVWRVGIATGVGAAALTAALVSGVALLIRRNSTSTPAH